MNSFVLSKEEVRVLGALLEKSMATPDYYPMTLNGLINACNQKSNRNPVVAYDEETVHGAVADLIDKQLAVRSDSGRVVKYAECFVGNAKLLDREAALVCLLLLRGPQTPGELRGRSERLYKYDDLAAVNETLTDLVEMGLVKKLARQAGRKESRFTHLLSGDIAEEFASSGTVMRETYAARDESGGNRLGELAMEVDALKKDLEDLRQQFMDFKKQFE